MTLYRLISERQDSSVYTLLRLSLGGMPQWAERPFAAFRPEEFAGFSTRAAAVRHGRALGIYPHRRDVRIVIERS